MLAKREYYFRVECGGCAAQHLRKPDWLGSLCVDLYGILWWPVENIGTRSRSRAEESNRAHLSPQFPRVHQPRSNLAAFPQKLDGTLKVKCRHGHDLRRRLEWIEAEVAERIESGSERPIRL